MHTAFNYIVAGIPFNDSFPSWVGIKQEIKYPADLQLKTCRYHDTKRFVVPTECVLRSLKPRFPEIGRVYGTNYVQYAGKLMKFIEARDELITAANIEPLADLPYNLRDNAWWEKERQQNQVKSAIAASLEDCVLYAVELYVDFGDDGHTDYELTGLALVHERHIEDVVVEMVRGDVDRKNLWL